MSSIEFIRKDVDQQMTAARELIEASSEIDQILARAALPDSEKSALQAVQTRLGLQIDRLLNNVDKVQQSLIQVMRSGARG